MSTRTFPVSGPINLRAKIGAGSIRVVAEEGRTEAVVDVVAQKPESGLEDRTIVELRGSQLVVETPKIKGRAGFFDLPFWGGHGGLDALDVTVRLPAGSRVDVQSYFADVTVDGPVGKTDIAGGSSTIAVEDVSDSLRLRYGSGTARVTRVNGSATVRCGSGSISFGDVSGSVDVGRGSGDVTVGTARGGVRARGGSGDVVVHAAYGDVDLVSGSGTMTVGIPQGVAARLDVTTGSGELHSDLPVEDAPANPSRRITIRAKTGSGDVRLVRAMAG